MAAATTTPPAYARRGFSRNDAIAVKLVAAIGLVARWAVGPGAGLVRRTMIRIRSLVLQVGGIGVGVWGIWQFNVTLGALSAMFGGLALEFLLREPVAER